MVLYEIAGVVLGIVCVVSGVLAWLGWVPRTGRFVISPFAVRSPEAFRASNRAGGPALAAGGVVSVIAALLAHSLSWPGLEIAYVCGAVGIVLCLVISRLLADRAARRVLSAEASRPHDPVGQ
jgi:hypothetical protein